MPTPLFPESQEGLKSPLWLMPGLGIATVAPRSPEISSQRTRAQVVCFPAALTGRQGQLKAHPKQ